MPFDLSDDEQLIAKVVAEFARDQVTLDGASERDRHDNIPTEIWQSGTALGLDQLAAEEPGPTAYALACLELARVEPTLAAWLAVHTTGNRLAPGTGRVALAFTEEAHGADKPTLGTVFDGTLTGMKVWVTGAAGADRILVLARAPEGPTLYEVAADANGLQLGQSEPLVGLRAAGIRTVYFDGVEATQVGEAGKAIEMWHAARPWLQVGAAAAIVGATLGGFAAAQEFASTRIQFGKAIGNYGAVSEAVTEVDLQAQAARALTLEAAARLGQDDDHVWAARARAFAGDMAVPMTRKNIRIQGGTGFMREGGTERFARDVRALRFLGEPPALQREILKRELLDIDFGPSP